MQAGILSLIESHERASFLAVVMPSGAEAIAAG